MSHLLPNILFSYPGEYSRFVEYTASILEKYVGEDHVFHYSDENTKQERDVFFNKLLEWLPAKNPFYFVCLTHKRKLVVAQWYEAERVAHELFKRHAVGKTSVVLADVSAGHGNPSRGDLGKEVPTALTSDWYEDLVDLDHSSAERLAEHLLRDYLDIPVSDSSSKAFTYEKDISKFFAELESAFKRGPLLAQSDGDKGRFIAKFELGVPMVWPSVQFRTNMHPVVRPEHDELAAQIGEHRSGLTPLTVEVFNETNPNLVRVSALENLGVSELFFLEAGPRAKVANIGRVAILVTGGIAPGVNAVIDGIVQRHHKYNPHCEIHGFTNGFYGLSQNPPIYSHLYANDQAVNAQHPGFVTPDHVSKGGSIIGTFRLPRLDEKGQEATLASVLTTLSGYRVVYIIGGDGGMKMADMLMSQLRKRHHSSTSIIGIPKSMDNDILWVWQSFGFATAVEKARDVIDSLAVEVNSNPRVCIVQLFGSVSGFVVSHAVLACQPGECDAALIPEEKFSIAGVANLIMDRTQGAIPRGLIVMAETAVPTDWKERFTEEELREVLTQREIDELELFAKLAEDDYHEGQTSDELRRAGLKVLQAGLEKLLQGENEFARVFANEPRHMLRSSRPSFSDIIFGQRLGALAVDSAVAGYSDFMISQWLTEFVLVPLKLVSIGRKRILKRGMFWKSVLAKTGQPDL